MAWIIASLAGLDFIPNYGVEIYPFGWVFIVVCIGIMIYAMARYRLLDVSIVLTRTSIFIAVYSLVLGLPFLVAFGAQEWLKGYIGEMWWLTPLILLTVLATAGPFIYLYIQRRAEEKLFQDQRRYQATLRQAATGMGRIKDMDKLIGLIENVVTESVGVEHCEVYTAGRLAHGSSLMAKSKSHQLSAISDERGRSPQVYSELKQWAADNPGDMSLKGIIAEMEELNAELIVPVILDEKVIAHIAIGRKVSGELFSDDDIAVFEILASQAALGFENAQFYDGIKAANEKLFQAEKLAYVGTMASSIVHEIRNPLTSIKAYLEFLPKKYHEADFREKFNRLIPGEVARIERIVGQLLDLVKRRPMDFKQVNLTEILDSTLEMLENSFQLKNISIHTNYKCGVSVKGDSEQLKQVFINLLLNAVQAMENGGEITICLSDSHLRQTDETDLSGCHLSITDTGCGIPEEKMQRLFEPFVTTKKDGIGLGLPILKEIIERHNGAIRYESKEGEGTRVYVTLPTC